MRYSRALLFASVLALCVGGDQATKLAATPCLDPAAALSVAADILTGAAKGAV